MEQEFEGRAITRVRDIRIKPKAFVVGSEHMQCKVRIVSEFKFDFLEGLSL